MLLVLFYETSHDFLFDAFDLCVKQLTASGGESNHSLVEVERRFVMPTTSSVLAGKFRDIVARVGAAFREQRAIDARRALQRYHHLLAQPRETLPLNETIPASNEDDISGHAHGSDACERAAGHATFEGA
jgi:hypothetical protein